MNLNDFKEGFNQGLIHTVPSKWEEAIVPKKSYLLTGDIGTGKSALAMWLLESIAKIHGLLPAIVGQNISKLLPENFICPNIETLREIENTIAFIDEADLQLPIENVKQRQIVVDFLSLPRKRNQILILCFHFPRLVLSRYLPYFGGFLFKRPPYLLEFSGKRQGDELVNMMRKAEERFTELNASDIVKNTYVVAPHIRWQGMLQNPLCSFWTEELSKAWAGHNNLESDFFSSLPLGKSAVIEQTTEQRLLKCGISPAYNAKVIDMDRKFSLTDLQAMCRERGLPITGDKKKLCAQILLQEVSGGERMDS